MKRFTWIPAVLLTLALAAPAIAAPQAPQVGQVRRAGPDIGFSFAAAAANIVYFPLRFALTVATAHVGGLAAWLNGGDHLTAQTIWASTDGQAYITPDILEGRERLQFGPFTQR
jgi:hypothetical protein